jgi:hypothetical protein
MAFRRTQNFGRKTEWKESLRRPRNRREDTTAESVHDSLGHIKPSQNLYH